MGKYYINQYIKNIAKLDSGEGDQVETDPIKRYLNELATKAIQKGTLYTNLLNPQEVSPVTIITKEIYTTDFNSQEIQINSENKIGDENNYEFVIIEYPDDADFSNPENRKTIFENSKYIFVDEENTVYFLNKFIKISTKQFIKSVLYSMNFENATTLFDGLDINAKNFEEKIDVNNYKFVLPMDDDLGKYIIIDDIDLKTFYDSEGSIMIIFYENEDKIIFRSVTDTYGTYDEYRRIEFIFSNNPNYEIITGNVNGINFKSLRRRSGGQG